MPNTGFGIGSSHSPFEERTPMSKMVSNPWLSSPVLLLSFSPSAKLKEADRFYQVFAGSRPFETPRATRLDASKPTRSPSLSPSLAMTH